VWLNLGVRVGRDEEKQTLDWTGLDLTGRLTCVSMIAATGLRWCRVLCTTSESEICFAAKHMLDASLQWRCVSQHGSQLGSALLQSK
jgi:hypothetical protein